MAINDEARQRREKLHQRAWVAIKKAHALHVLCKADVAIVIIHSGERYEYRSDDMTTWPQTPQVVHLALCSTYVSSNTDAEIAIWKSTAGFSPSYDVEGADNGNISVTPNQTTGVSSPSEQLYREMATSKKSYSHRREEDSLATTRTFQLGFPQGFAQTVEAGVRLRASLTAIENTWPSCTTDTSTPDKLSVANVGH